MIPSLALLATPVLAQAGMLLVFFFHAKKHKNGHKYLLLLCWFRSAELQPEIRAKVVKAGSFCRSQLAGSRGPRSERSFWGMSQRARPSPQPCAVLSSRGTRL